MEGKFTYPQQYQESGKRIGDSTASDILNEFKVRLDSVLESFLSIKTIEAGEISSEAAGLVNEIGRFTRNGGKRVRPLFVYAGYLSSGGLAQEAILVASLSVEMLHTFALIHDDIIDNSDLRRGQPTTHKMFESTHQIKKFKGNPTEFGLSAAILAGDIAVSFANEILNESPFPNERIRRAKYYFNKMKQEVEIGQYLDVVNGYKQEVNEDEVLKVLEYKTAKYTVERPLHIGAALAGADPDIYKVFTAYGLPFGQAFQIQDDILGTFGETKKIGKPNDSDIKEGKKTILIVKAMGRADLEQKAFLAKNLGNKFATDSEIGQVRDIIKRTGALSYAMSLSQHLLNQAKQVVYESKVHQDGKEYLLAAVDYLQARLS